MQAGHGQAVAEHSRHSGCKLLKNSRQRLSRLSNHSKPAVQRASHLKQKRPPQVAALASASAENSHSASESSFREQLPSWGVAALSAAGAATVGALLALPAHAKCDCKCHSGGGCSGGGNHDGGDGGDGGGDGQSGAGGSSKRHLADIADDDDDEEEEEEEEGEEEEEEEDADEDEAEENESTAGAVESEGADAELGDSFFCKKMFVSGLRSAPGVPTEEDLFAVLDCQPGFNCTREELTKDLQALVKTGLFDTVDARVKPLGKGQAQVEFVVKERKYKPIESVKIVGHKCNRRDLMIPKDHEEKIMQELKRTGATDLETMGILRNMTEGWYQERGFPFGYVTQYNGFETGNVEVSICEGKVGSVDVVYVDDSGNPVVGRNETPKDVVLRSAPFRKGQGYNTEDGRKALRDIFGMGLFDNVQVVPKQNARDETKIDVEVMVKERPMKTADLQLEWSLAKGESGKPMLVTPLPGGSLTYEDRNFMRKGRTITAEVQAQSFLQPADDLTYRIDYKHPNIRGADDPNKAQGTISIFNSRKMSGVFAGTSGGEEVPPVWVDRAGAKVGITETYTRNSKGSLGLVVEEVTVQDENGQRMAKGARAMPDGSLIADGPPTTFSDSGRDHVAFLQGTLMRDTTYFLNSAPLGDRDVVQVDQGFGLGNGAPIFNRHQLSCTRFLQLPILRPIPGSTAPPASLILHGRYGGCIGDLASYDCFTLGGPHSVRGFNVGELATCRRFLEGSAEVRLPVLNRQVFAFYETGSDLGSSHLVKGNPTEYFRRAGSGSSYGVGLKLGAVRAEYATDNNSGKGALFLRYGERY